MTTITEHDTVLRTAGLPTIRTLTTRILRVFDRASKSDVESGAQWYDDGRALVVQWSLESGYSVEHCAVVLAHLSPRTSWTRNVLGAGALLRSGEQYPGIMGDTFERAVDSLDFEDPLESFGKDAHKTKRFALNFLGDRESVTVDVWAARVAGIDAEVLKRKGVYDAVEVAYQRAAVARGVEPATMQATTWILARGGRVG